MLYHPPRRRVTSAWFFPTNRLSLYHPDNYRESYFRLIFIFRFTAFTLQFIHRTEASVDLWGEQDSNLWRLSQQIYSLSSLAAWVSPPKPLMKLISLASRVTIIWFIFIKKNEPAKGFEPPTCWLQISCSTSWATPAIRVSHWGCA